MYEPAPIRAHALLLIALTTAALCAGKADAVTIYRCGAAGNSFSDTPCAGGKTFEADDPRSDAQRDEAVRVAAVDRRLAAELQAERLRTAARQPPQAGGFHAQRQRPTAMPAWLLVADGHRGPKKRTPPHGKLRWIYDDREEFIAYAPPAAGKPRRR